jgi:hypothetical protein
MRYFESSTIGRVSMDPKVKYGCSIKEFENEKRSLRRTDQDDERIRMMREALRAQRKKSL